MKNIKKPGLVDLHSHSTASDGTFSPSELVAYAQSQGVRTLALTDHDTVQGIDEAFRAAKKKKIRFIPGIEIEVDFQPGEFHLLGLGLKDWHHGSLPRALEKLIRYRNARNHRMLELIQKDGVPLTWRELEEISGGEVIARPHFADLLVRHGKAKNRLDAFQNYLTPGKAYYLSREAFTLEEALHMVKEAGGIPILAHPLSLHVSWGRLPKLLEEWKEAGLQGLEAFHSGARMRDAHRLSALAEHYGLVISGGSDFHGARRPDRKMGRGPDQKKLTPDFFLPLTENLLDCP